LAFPIDRLRLPERAPALPRALTWRGSGGRIHLGPFNPESELAMEGQTTPPQTAVIQYDDFAKLELRVATVLECKAHPNADKLLVLQIDLGTERRQICAGLRQHYQPEQLVGKQIVVVANLAPRTMRGEISQGMLLAATDPNTSKVIFVSPSEPAAPGSKVS
jgi:tRNA-binding protein